jgi:TonB-dependent receptor
MQITKNFGKEVAKVHSQGFQLAVSIFFCCATHLALAQNVLSAQSSIASSNNFYSVTIPAQQLSQSLADVSRLVDQPIIYNPSQFIGTSAVALNGKMTAAKALQKLLEGTEFIAEWNHQGWVIKAAGNKVQESEHKPVIAPQVTEEVVVTGYYSRNLQAALNEKRQRAEMIDAIVVEDIEKFPAQNIAEALQHSPGITVVRDRGEALFVSIRGLPTNFNKVTLNSNTLATNENVRNSGQYGRRFHFDTFPAELVAGVEVIKSTSAEQDEGAIGGSINIRTFSPFELAKTQLSISAALDESELASSVKPRVSMLGSWINSEHSLGITLAASLAERSLRQDRALNFGWVNVAGIKNTNGDSGERIITPSSFRPTLELEDRQRQGVTGTLQWKPTDALDVDAHWLSLAQTIDYSEFSYGSVYPIDNLLADSLKFRNGALVAGETGAGSTQISRESAGIVDTNRALDVKVKWQLENWNISSTLADSSAHSYNTNPIKRIRLHRENDVGFSFSYPKINGNSVPAIEYKNLDLESAGDFYGRRLEWRVINAEDHEQAFGLNGSYWVDGDSVKSIDVGIKVNQHQRGYDRKDALVIDNFSGQYFPRNYYEPFPVKTFLGYTNQQLPTQWLIPNEDKFWSGIDETYFYQKPLSQSDLLNSYDIKESSRAIFIKANLAGAIAAYEWHGNVGVRAIYTQQRSQGYSLSDDLSSPQLFENDYQKLLPSANFVLQFSPHLLWRTAISSALTRPDFQDLAPRLTLNSGESLTAVGGNPNLKPVDALQFDSAVEWYMANTGLLSAGIFYKHLNHFFQNQISYLPINGKLYALSAVGNGAQARVNGAEFSYQQKMAFLPSPFNHLGLETNYTYTDSVAEYITASEHFYDDLADVAKHSINVGGYFETESANIRLNYSWRDKVLNQVGTANMSAQNTAAFGSLDMHLSYSLGERGLIKFDAINLANTAQEDFVANKEFANYTLYGRRFLVGVKWNIF